MHLNVKIPILVLSISVSLALAGGAAATTTPVTACGQSIPNGVRGILQNDLDCTSGTQTVVVGSGATLDLNGHTISVAGIGSVVDVHSPGSHTVRGPGRLVNVTIACGVGFNYRRSLRVRSVDIVSTRYGAIDCLDQNHFRQNPIDAQNVDISGDSDFGITGQDVKLRNVSVAGSKLVGILAVNVKGRSVSVVGNAGSGIRSDFSSANNVILKDSQIRDNLGWGIVSHFIRAANSTITGNGSTDGYDLASDVLPQLLGSTCERSFHFGPAMPWGICSND